MNNRRKQILKRYIERLSNLSNINLLMNYEPDKYDYWLFGIRTNVRDKLMLYLKNNGVATGCHYTPLHMQPLFSKKESSCIVAEQEYKKFMTLPLHVDLSNEEIDYVIELIEDFSKTL